MLVLVIRKFDQISIENKVAVPGTTFPPFISLWEIFHRSKASNSNENDPTWPKCERVRDFMPLLDIYKFEKVVIKTEGAMPRTMSNIIFFITQGQKRVR